MGVDRPSPGPIDAGPLERRRRAVPQPGPAKCACRVRACGVCRTDLHLAEGDLPPHRPDVVPGHEVVGEVDEVGEPSTRFAVGDRVGIAWLRRTCGRCRWCRRGARTCVSHPRSPDGTPTAATPSGRVVDEAYAYRSAGRYDDVHAAPLLCAGIVGYRALRRAELPPGGRLGIYGFGASAHLVAQVAIAQGATVHVLTRSCAAQEHALALGAASGGPADSGAARAARRRDPVRTGRCARPGRAAPRSTRAARSRSPGIHLSDIPPLDYERDLFQERQVRSVTANTRADGEAFLALAARLDLRVEIHRYPLDRADAALSDLAHDRVTGAAVLVP